MLNRTMKAVSSKLLISELFWRTPREGLFDCLVYIANDNTIGKPQPEYIERINSGIKSSKLPKDYVEKCIRPFVPEN